MATNGTASHQRPLEVVIIGAGIGGLCAAIGLRQQGHNVSIYEKSKLAEETGAAIHLAPNCHGLLKRLGLDPRQHGSVKFQGLTEYTEKGEIKQSLELGFINDMMWQHSWELIHRAHLHTALKEIATSKQGSGTPVKLHLGSLVERVNPAEPSIEIAGGDVVRGDVVIGADGVHSKSRSAIPGGNIEPFDSGKSAFRFLVPTAQIAEDEKTSTFLQHKNHMLMWVGEDRRVVMYPCVGGTQMNFVGIHPSRESSKDESGDAWQQVGSKDRLLKNFESFGPNVSALLDKADAPKIYTLFDMAKMPSFVHERFAILGDGAHPFLPHQAQGGAQAIEDALSLAAMLPLGTTSDDIPDRLQLYEKQRYERSHRIQEFTRLSGADLKDGQQLDVRSFTAYNVGHDEWHASTSALYNHLASKDPARKWQSPFIFKPAPSSSGEKHCTVITTKIKSSRTYLQMFLPPGFSFVSPATICEASIECVLSPGHNSMSLRLHGITYTKKSGEKIFGTFVPVILGDGPSVAGLPTLPATFSMSAGSDRLYVEIKCEGYTVASIHQEGLEKASEEPPSGPPKGGPPPPPDNGDFYWGSIGAGGTQANDAAEYPIFKPRQKGETASGMQTRIAKTSAMSFKAGSKSDLPTMYHIAKRLADIPIYGIVEGKQTVDAPEDGIVGHWDSAQRIE